MGTHLTVSILNVVLDASRRVLEAQEDNCPEYVKIHHGSQYTTTLNLKIKNDPELLNILIYIPSPGVLGIERHSC